ncbi:GL22881 [Drosophila persimilis]|uniref:GL22881 n=1 Tax=Drosophila persimilis TaxID=7234 RepID=B4GZY3_DROPE|nr:GL22881 [Drosophila persimilis]
MPDRPYDEHRERYSSSTVGLLKLLELEMQFIENLKNYTDLLSAKANTLQDLIDSVDRGTEKTLTEREKYVYNPLNAFGLMRRTHQDWPKWHHYINTTVGRVELQALDDILGKAPDSQDMKEALIGMNRIERTYALEAKDLAKGRLLDKQYDIQLSIRDCLSLGQHKFQEGDYFRASMWYRMAIKHQPEPNAKEFNTILGDPLKDLKQNYAKATIIHGDLQQGGATIFPLINITVSPRKGSALLWFNLYDDGEPDPRTLHSSCPVIEGDRWMKQNGSGSLDFVWKQRLL